MDPLQGLTRMNRIVDGLRRKGKYGPPTFWLRVGSKKNSAPAQIFRLARTRLLSQISPRAGHRRLHDTGASHSDGWFRLCIPGGHSDGRLLKEDGAKKIKAGSDASGLFISLQEDLAFSSASVRCAQGTKSPAQSRATTRRLPSGSAHSHSNTGG